MDPSKFQTYRLFFPLNGNNTAITLYIPKEWTLKFFFLFQKNDYAPYKQTQHNTLIVKGRLATVEYQSNNPRLNPDILYAMVKLQGFDVLYPTLQLEERIINAVYHSWGLYRGEICRPSSSVWDRARATLHQPGVDAGLDNVLGQPR